MDSSNPLSAIQLPVPNPSEAESSGGKAASQNPTPVQTPPLAVMMQQAVAMQQFQFQQALLMQQVITAQQAATRAATLKSAAEMAAARAAEISKQLKGSDEEDAKPLEKSKSRSISNSASRSLSHSRSKSRSRSPIRYRRGRSNSRSPIRYRREYYSPSRSRDYYGYRSRGYRSYYRGGRSEYSWNMYRRERDRDYYYRNSRRSRSRGRRRSRTKSRSPRRSRSRGRRRSRTSSRSPRRRRSHSRPSRQRRDRSLSPKHKRDERKLHQTSKRSVSREAARSLSAISGSVSGSPFQKDGSRSPSMVKTGSDKLSNAESPLQEEEKTNEKKVSHSSSHTDQSGHLNEERSANSFKKGSNAGSPAKTRSSSTPVRSLSVSVDFEQNEIVYHEDAQGRSPDKDAELHMRFDISDDSFKNQNNILKDSLEKGKRTGSEDIVKTCHSIVSSHENNLSVEELTLRKPIIVPNALFDEESEYDEVLDDWRDDLKPASKAKENSTYGSIDTKKKVENDRRTNSLSDTQRPNSNVTLENKLSDSTLNDEGIQGCTNLEEESNVKTLTGSMSEQEAIPSRGYIFLDALVAGDKDKLSNEDDVEGRDDARERDENAIFEGPRPVIEDEEERMERLDSLRADSESYVAETELLPGKDGDRSCMIAPDQERIFDMGSEDDNGVRDIAENIERDEQKVRHRSHSKDSKKREDDLAKHDKRRDRHKKHKRKHRHEDVDQDKVDGSDEKKDEGHRSRKRHRRKHKRDSEHGHKEKKKRKHKHKAKSPSDSVEESLLVEKDDGRDDEDHNVVKKKISKRHRKSKRDVSDSPPPSATSSG